MLRSASWSAMVFPAVLDAFRIDRTPSMSIRPGGQGTVEGHSLLMSMAGVSASVPDPEIGQTFPPGGLSRFGTPDARLVVQVALCQSGLLSLRTPKFDPPTISR